MEEKERYKSWIYLSGVLFLAFTIAGRIFNIPHTPLSTMALWVICYLIIIIIGVVYICKFFSKNRKV